MIEAISTDLKEEKAILIGVLNQNQSQEEVEDYLSELAFLTETAGAIATDRRGTCIYCRHG